MKRGLFFEVLFKAVC